jgi:hypothetical protein
VEGVKTALIFAFLFSALRGQQSISIDLKNGTDAEQKTKEQLQRLIASYDLSRYTYTRQILIDEKAIPHSHPVLTLHTRHLDSDDALLSAYVHEQLHWFLAAHQKQTDAAESRLRKIYPKVPVGYPDGAQDEESTYLHLIDCYLEMEADRQLLGNVRTTEVMKYWAGDHYRWIYKTVMEDESKIGAIVAQQHLSLKDAQTH